MRISKNWGTHLPVLIKLVGMTDGDILELGAGLYSTPYLHWACFPTKRYLVTYDNNKDFHGMLKDYRSDFHKTVFLDNFDNADIEKPWDIAFVDHAPDIRRSIEAGRLAQHAKFVVIHDSDPKNAEAYKYDDIYKLFKYRFDFKDVTPNTTVLSNFINLDDFKV